MERWIVIEDHPNYEVSSCGRVRNRRTGRILVPQLNKGYERVNLDGQHCYIHRLVAIAFYDSHDTSLQINHIDGDRRNNNVYNLEWCTSRENIRHAVENGLMFPSKIKVVRCKYCKYRYEFDICEDKDDGFYCGYGEHI